jgi:GNAT superfamily N-acetyltransferase
VAASLVAARLAVLAGSRADAVFVAVEPSTGRVLGVVGAHVLPLLHAEGSIARLTALAVRAAAQGQGIGRALLGAVEAFARARGCHRVEVTSGDQRPGADAFYTAAGYRVDERRFIKHIQPSPETGSGDQQAGGLTG